MRRGVTSRFVSVLDLAPTRKANRCSSETSARNTPARIRVGPIGICPYRCLRINVPKHGGHAIPLYRPFEPLPRRLQCRLLPGGMYISHISHICRISLPQPCSIPPSHTSFIICRLADYYARPDRRLKATCATPSTSARHRVGNQDRLTTNALPLRPQAGCSAHGRHPTTANSLLESA